MYEFTGKMSEKQVQQQQTTRPRTDLKIDMDLTRKLDEIGRSIYGKKKPRPKIIRELIRKAAETSAASGTDPIATYDAIMAEPAPVVIYGKGGLGKSYTLDMFMKRAAQELIPIFLLNSANIQHETWDEHIWIERVLNYYELSSLSWLDIGDSFRVNLESELEFRKSNVRELSKLLLRLEGDTRLRDWIIAVEEAHDYHKVEPFRAMLRRMRKSVKKIVIIATEKELFEMCQPMRPLPKFSAPPPPSF
jgi:hypothetical protein